MRDLRKPIGIALAACTLAAPAPAGAQVFVDPDSPSAKEYAIPFDAARRDAAPAGDPPVSGGSNLFGAGVGDGGGPSNAKSTVSSGAPKTSSQQVQPSSGSVEEVIQSSPAVRAAVPQGGIESTVTIAAVAFSVLLLGGVIGSAMRRRGVS